MATKAKTSVSKPKEEAKKVIPKLEEIAPKTKEEVSVPEEVAEPAQEMMTVPEASVAEIASVQNTETLPADRQVANDESDKTGMVEKSEEKKPYVVPPSPNASAQPIRSFVRAPLPPRVPFQPRFAPVRPVYQRTAGILEMTGTDGRGILRHGFRAGEDDILIPSMVSRLSKLRAGDVITGLARRPKETEPYWTMIQITKVNGEEPAKMFDRFRFEKGTPIYPFEKLKLETGKEILSTRLIDLCAPIGRGQRGLIVSPPKAGKTTVIKEIASGIASNYPEIHLMAVLVGERPEEVTDISRHILAVTKDSTMPGETAASNFDEKAEEQTRVAEMALERAKRLVEMGKDVVILLDSVTRLARAYNLAIPTSGRTLSGGFDPAALYPPKKFFGAARKIEGGGSLTIIGTALTDTGSRMDDLVYEEFKGTGNMELHLDRRLAERRIYPAIDVMRSGTRRDDLLFDSMEYQSIILMRRMLDMLGDNERTEVLIGRLART
ncbi:MAG: Transcription termination factor Rho, partial [Candidatus Collierbacteria bacterium GW2011_GWB1_44_197]